MLAEEPANESVRRHASSLVVQAGERAGSAVAIELTLVSSAANVD